MSEKVDNEEYRMMLQLETSLLDTSDQLVKESDNRQKRVLQGCDFCTGLPFAHEKTRKSTVLQRSTCDGCGHAREDTILQELFLVKVNSRVDESRLLGHRGLADALSGQDTDQRQHGILERQGPAITGVQGHGAS